MKGEYYKKPIGTRQTAFGTKFHFMLKPTIYGFGKFFKMSREEFFLDCANFAENILNESSYKDLRPPKLQISKKGLMEDPLNGSYHSSGSSAYFSCSSETEVEQ